MTRRHVSLCLSLFTFTAACSDDKGGDTDDGGTASTGEDSATTGPTTGGEPTTGEPTTGDESTAGEDTTAGETGEAGHYGGCGLPPYAMLDAADMGEVLDHELVVEFDAETINGLLELQGFGMLVPVDHGARVYKIRYVTQDRGEAVEATAFISFPMLDTPADRPVIMYAHGTTGFSDKCAPTADPQGYAVPVILAALGYVAVAPDYLGMNGWGEPAASGHPYIVPEPTAIASLDSLRALARFAGDSGEAVPATPGADIVLFGISEGGFATLWADRYAPFYAPEFKITANVASVPPTDAYALTEHGTTVFGPTTGALAAAVVGGHAWHRLASPLSDVLSDDPAFDVSVELPKMMAETCSIEIPDTITQTNQVYQQAFIDALGAEDFDALGEVGCILDRATLRTSQIPLEVATPTLVVLGEADDLVFTPVVRADLPKLCDAGYAIEHFECAGAGHVEAATDSIPFVLDWVDARLAGDAIVEPCVIHKAVDCTML
jgi:dienelactone hydrolase